MDTEAESQNIAVMSKFSTATSENYTEGQTSRTTKIVEMTEVTKPNENLELITFCHEMDEYQKAFGESCINVHRNFSQSLMLRDILLERLLQKAWLTFAVYI